MASSLELSGRLALLAGLLAVSVAIAFAYLNGGMAIAPIVDALSGTGGSLLGYIGLTLVFEFGIPVICAAAFFFGVPARSLWSARLGMASATMALACYALFLGACYRMVAGSRSP